MFMRNAVLAVAAVLAALTSAPSRAAGPGLGVPVSEADLAPLAISVFPDGRGLPPGQATAIDGVDAYVTHCARCHGLRGQGKPGPALVGGIGSLGTKAPVKTVGSFWPHASTLFDYTRRTMPYDRPMSLTDKEVYGVTAYVLWLNAIIGKDFVLDAQSLPKVRMPNREGFVDASQGTPGR